MQLLQDVVPVVVDPVLLCRHGEGCIPLKYHKMQFPHLWNVKALADKPLDAADGGVQLRRHELHGRAAIGQVEGAQLLGAAAEKQKRKQQPLRIPRKGMLADIIHLCICAPCGTQACTACVHPAVRLQRVSARHAKQQDTTQQLRPYPSQIDEPHCEQGSHNRGLTPQLKGCPRHETRQAN